MGNLSFLIPTERKENITQEYVHNLLKQEFPEIRFDNIFEGGFSIYKGKQHIENLYFGEQCYILSDLDGDIKDLREDGNEDQALSLETFRDLNLGKDCIQMTYGEYPFEVKQDIDLFLHHHFKAYWFDEGIHPEHMNPEYKGC